MTCIFPRYRKSILSPNKSDVTVDGLDGNKQKKQNRRFQSKSLTLLEIRFFAFQHAPCKTASCHFYTCVFVLLKPVRYNVYINELKRSWEADFGDFVLSCGQNAVNLRLSCLFIVKSPSGDTRGMSMVANVSRKYV